MTNEDMTVKVSEETYTDENGASYDIDTHEHDKTYENEQSMVTIPLREYDKLKEQKNYITDPSLIAVIDKIEELTRALRKHIVRKF
tara:strand:+ start:81 stop:338 length:258 start_codon:yes stop_codon:yes gene_type:complete